MAQLALEGHTETGSCYPCGLLSGTNPTWLYRDQDVVGGGSLVLINKLFCGYPELRPEAPDIRTKFVNKIQQKKAM